MVESAPFPTKRKALMNYSQLTKNEHYLPNYSLKTAGHSQIEIAKQGKNGHP
ncbi:hypothetical protein SAMN05660479_03377 [Microbulbifer thermotolerans]|uniref:hypothetical protein n=1 Tax=Microbulbifer thermotolerans TaxID=252514 RepID=UPI0008EC2678|nr:hypothetical protein [Microbulbifer thermotolerans]MCX2841047.1 hypothetical protein [Microbulbifer thermotolerans]SFD18833.1 hypothetical protein SAMN05660479_03377 [Microbulbifer thermotolerans]